jgi:hypothetical protein
MTVVVDSIGKNIGSAYDIADGTYAWSVVVATGDGQIEFRRGRHKTQRGADRALLAGAKELVASPRIEE